MKLFSLLISLVWCAQHAAAQDYVVTILGDTIHGKIKEPTFEYVLYFKVVMKEDERKVYHAEDLRCYQLDGEQYLSEDLGDGSYVFLKPLVTGYCSLYKYEYLMSGGGGGTMPAMKSQVTTYFMHKEGGPFHEYWFAVLKNGRDLYFVDDPQLTFDLRHGKYKKGDMQQIVMRYNDDKKGQQSTP